MEIKVVKKMNKDKKAYIALLVDLGYTQKVLSFNSQDIAEICGISVRDLYTQLDDGQTMYIGDIKF